MHANSLLKVVRDTPAVRKELTFVVQLIGNMTETVTCYWSIESKLIVPKYTMRPKKQAQVPLELPTSEFQGDLRGEQEVAARAIYNDLQLNHTSLAYLPTGYGKTVIAIATASCLAGLTKIIIFVHKLALKMQWEEAFDRFAPHLSSIVDIRTVQKQLHNISELSDYTDDCLLVIDETHHFAAECFQRILQNSKAEYTLALSATAERRDGLSKILELYLGAPSIEITTLALKPTVEVHRFDAGEETYKFAHRGVRGESVLDFNNVLDKLTQCNKRNMFIIDLLVSLGERNVLILSKRRQHTTYLYNYYKALKPDEDVRCILGGMKKKDLEAAREVMPDQKSLRLFGTVSSCGEGFDMCVLNCLLFATPCSSVQQEVGRVLRKANPETPPKVIDIVDACGPLYAQFAKRKAFYLAQEFVIVDRNAPVPREMPFVLS